MTFLQHLFCHDNVEFECSSLQTFTHMNHTETEAHLVCQHYQALTLGSTACPFPSRCARLLRHHVRTLLLDRPLDLAKHKTIGIVSSGSAGDGCCTTLRRQARASICAVQYRPVLYLDQLRDSENGSACTQHTRVSEACAAAGTGPTGMASA